MLLSNSTHVLKNKNMLFNYEVSQFQLNNLRVLGSMKFH